MEYKDYYKTLGVPRTATPAEIKKAYRRLAREFHPDHNPGSKTAEAKFKEINEANEVLGDPPKRQQYDMLGANWGQYAQAGSAAAGAAGNPFGQGGPFAGYQAGQGGNVRYEYEDADIDSFSDFFRMFFGGGRAKTNAGGGRSGGASSAGAASFEDLFTRQRAGQAGGASAAGSRGGDVQVEVDMSLEEAFHGSTRLVQIGNQRLEVKVPAGVDTGSKIRLRGKAGAGSGAGDLYLVARVRPDSTFSRNSADLTRELPITLKEALLGAEVEVETMRGKVLLKIPAGTQQGQSFRLKGQGMPRLKGEGAGDLYARVKIVVPDKLDGKQRKAAEEFLGQIDQPNPRRT